MNSLEGDPIPSAEKGLLDPSAPRKNYADLAYPWLAPPAPTALHVERAARDWVLAEGLLAKEQLARRFDPVNVGLLTALCYPRAPLERQELIAQLLAWIFIQDDVFDEAVAQHDPERLRLLLEGYAAILRGDAFSRMVESAASPARAALASLRERIVAIADPTWMDWFCESMRGFWIDGIVEETRIRSLGITPDRATYTRMRVQSIGVMPFIDLVELAEGFAIPRVVCADPSVMRLRVRTAEIISWANDVFSYEKERRAGDPNNLVHVLMEHQGLSLADAVDRVVRIHDREVLAFERDVQALPYLGAVPHLDQLIQGHRDWMRGALDWQLLSRRYSTGRELLDDQGRAARLEEVQ
jgi:hypothetical protein